MRRRPGTPAEELHRARLLVVVSAVLVVVVTVLVLISYKQNAPLRGDDLRPAQGTVLDFDRNRRGPDEITVRYDVPGKGPQTADIPVGHRYRAGDQVQVLYVPDKPDRARTVQDWQPVGSAKGLIYPAIFLVVLAAGLVRLLVLRGRLKRGEPTARIGE